MIPAYELQADGLDITSRIGGRLLAIKVTDRIGMEADILDITLDDREGRIQLPRKGATLALQLGYEGSGLAHMGLFVVDKLEWGLDGNNGQTLHIRANAADMRESLKAQRTRTHTGTGQQIFARIAQEHGLQPAIGEPLASHDFGDLHQTGESDLHFCTRIGRLFGCVASPKHGRLVLARRGTGRSISGRSLTPILVRRTDLIWARASIADRPVHQSGVGYYHDWKAGRRKRVEERAEGGGLGGEGRGARFQLRDLFDDEALAGQAVRAQLAELDRLSSEVSVQITGNPLARAESPVLLEGVRDGIDGAYIAETVTHMVTGGGRNGYMTRIDCKTTDGQKGRSKGGSGPG